MFEPEKEYRVKVDGLLTRKAIREIEEMFEEKYGRRLMYDDLDGLEYVNQRGKITKRIKNNVKKRYDIKMDPIHISEVGNIAANNTVEEGEYVFRISRNMDVFDGHKTLYTNQSNSPSCFASGGSYHHHWIAMHLHEDYYAVRMATSENRDDLIARCWLYDNHNRGYLVVFNGYGLQLNEIALIMGKALDARVVDVAVDRSDLFVNGSRARALLPKDSPTRTLQYVNLMAGTRRDLRECGECGRYFSLDEEGVTTGTGHYCGDCLEICEQCHVRVAPGQLRECEFTGNLSCHSCRDRERGQRVCGSCHGRFEPGQLHSMQYYPGNYCEACSATCSNCDVMSPVSSVMDNPLPDAEGHLCPDCHFDVTMANFCYQCNEYLGDGEDTIRGRGSRVYCQGCSGSCHICGDNVLPGEERMSYTTGDYNTCRSCHRRAMAVREEIYYRGIVERRRQDVADWLLNHLQQFDREISFYLSEVATMYIVENGWYESYIRELMQANEMEYEDRILLREIFFSDGEKIDIISSLIRQRRDRVLSIEKVVIERAVTPY